MAVLLIKVLQYLPRTQDQRLKWGGLQVSGREMSAYVDSDHPTCLDSRRLMSGGAVQLTGDLIAWFSRALSPSEAEYIALAEIVKYIILLK